METAIQMALQPPKIYHMMQKAFSMYENGELKGQKIPNPLTSSSRKRALHGQYSTKAHHFKAFQGLQVNGVLTPLCSLLLNYYRMMLNSKSSQHWIIRKFRLQLTSNHASDWSIAGVINPI